MKYVQNKRQFLWLFAASFLFAVFWSPLSAYSQTLKVTEWVSKSDPLLVRSAIIEGPTEIGLVDTQFTLSNVHRIIADLIEVGKPLRWVYVTHPHVDHFNGAGLIRAAFPEAAFFALPAAIPLMHTMVMERQAGLGAHAPGGARNVAASAPTFFQRLPENGLAIDGQSVEVMTGFGDHPDSSVVWVPSARTVITGDVVFSHTHAFTGDHDNIEAWISLIERIKRLRPSRVVVGHGPVDVRRDSSVLDEQIQWLRDYRDARSNNPSAQSVKEIMTKKYPGYANDFIFEFSEGVRR
ncbi:MAG: MBL fold metallo-hydrolase [Rhodobacteraceae bacterium]|nr:MBL fold metallo-hydrolase [Paracoccaceae bacterium]